MKTNQCVFNRQCGRNCALNDVWKRKKIRVSCMATNMYVNYNNEPLFATPDFILNECEQYDTKQKFESWITKFLTCRGKAAKEKVMPTNSLVLPRSVNTSHTSSMEGVNTDSRQITLRTAKVPKPELKWVKLAVCLWAARVLPLWTIYPQLTV